MKKSSYLASMMCSNYAHLETEIKSLMDAGIDGYHMDIMDGHYVHNFGMDPSMIETIKKIDPNGTIDVHLMIQRPDQIIEKFLALNVDRIQFHPDSTLHALRLIQTIQAHGIEAGIVINPDTNIDVYESLFPYVDHVTLMTVSPGFAGQSFVETSYDRYQQLLVEQSKAHFEITIDGALSAQRVHTFDALAPNHYVLGTSSLFNETSFEDNLKILKRI